MSEIRFPLPDVGEGLTEAEIVQWRVAPGDRIALDQVFVEIETAKSLVELPSAFEGTVAELLVDEGNTVAVGTPILVIQTDAAEADAAAPAPSSAAPAAPAVPAPPAGTVASHAPTASEGGGAVLVGHGSSGPADTRRKRHPSPGGAHENLAALPTPAPPGLTAAPAAAAATAAAAAPARAAARPEARVPVIAKPPIRKLAKDLGVDLSRVTPTGPVGDITRDDVIRGANQASVFRNIQTPEWPTDREDRIPVKGVRKAIASAMVQSAFQAPHVSVFVDVDASRTMEYL
jgi:2-oxoisovalerate dehydrogenase E2 component (dihydrolipoyl transacylase)